MTRLCNPGKRLPDKSGEPDFYEISKKYPLPELPIIGIRPEQSDVDSLHAIRSPSAAVAAAAAHPHSVQRILFASPPIHHASAGANTNRHSQATAIPQLPHPMYFPAGPMEHPAFQQSPFGFYAPSQFMMAPPQSMPGGPPGYYVVYQPPPLFMQAPHGSSSTAPLPYAAALSGGQQTDMAALLAASALTSAGLGRDVQSAVRQTVENTVVTSNEACVKTESPEDAKPVALKGIAEDEKLNTEEVVVGNSTAEV